MEKEVKKLILLSSIGVEHNKFKELLSECLCKETLYNDMANNLKMKIWDRSRVFYNNDYDIEDITLISKNGADGNYFKLFLVYRKRESQRLTTGEIIIDADDDYTQNIFDEIINNYTNDEFRKVVNDVIFSHEHILSVLEHLYQKDKSVLVRSTLDESYRLDDYIFYLYKIRKDENNESEC